MQKKITIVIFTGILLLAAFFRLYGVNWDQNQHLHPDERFLTMVAEGIQWPKNFWEFLDTNSSPFNPHNRGFGFFVYGTFPVFFTKWIAESLGKGNYNQLTIVGRQLSALFDLGTVILVYLIAKQIISDNKNKTLNTKFSILNTYPLMSMFLYACLVLPIQLSHYFAVETYLTFFITLTSYLTILLIDNFSLKGLRTLSILTIGLGISFGLAFASKITAVLFLSVIFLGFLYLLIKYKNILKLIFLGFVFLAAGYITIRLAQPYLFSNSSFFSLKLNDKAISNWKELRSLGNPNAWFPPAVQWIHTKPYLYPLKHNFFYGLGPTISLIMVVSFCYLPILYWKLIKKDWRKLIQEKHHIFLFLNFAWIIILFLYQGKEYAKNLRYFYPLYPNLAILSGYSLSVLLCKLPKNKLFISNLILAFLLLIYPLSFISIYSRPHSRVTASIWIYDNIPTGSSISAEHWDDFVPMSLPTPGLIHEKYRPVEFPLYGADTKEKWQLMNENLKQTDYIILTSNRLYGAIMTVPERYPITYRYYRALFDGSLGYKKIAEFTSRPNLPIPFIKLCLTPPLTNYGFIAKTIQECPLTGISYVDDYADESFTVYDHPKVIIFKKVREVDYKKILKY